ncbi:MAG: Pyridoxal phosphate-dependent aminotransferase [Thermoproteota archaeon]|nr:Pyridoxal phosphate-dependent aminotransferase [Thermoproteota archaeon]
MDNSIRSLFEFGLDELAKRNGMKWSKYGRDVIPMWVADSDFGVAKEIKDSIIEAVRGEDLHYDDSSSLCEMIADKIRRINRIPVNGEDVLVTQGVIPPMWLACRYAFDRRGGDEAVMTDPMYYPFFTATETAGVKKMFWPLMEEDGYRFDIEALKEAITPMTRLMFVCNPHNPTGRVMTREELSAVADLAVDHDLVVMSDELWEDIVFDDKEHVSIASLNSDISERTLTVWGFSKSYNIAGLQIGYAATTNKEMLKELKRLSNGIFRETTTLSKTAAKTILSGKVDYYLKAELEYLRETREYAVKRLREIEGVKPNVPEGTYLLFPRVSRYKMKSNAIVKFLLEDAKVSVIDGSEFGSNGEGHVRINVGTSLNVLEEAFNRIQKSLNKQLH